MISSQKIDGAIENSRPHRLDIVAWAKGDPRLKRIPVIIVTSSRETSDMEKAYAAGANSYLVKPTSFREFVETMKITSTYWIHYNAGLTP